MRYSSFIVLVSLITAGLCSICPTAGPACTTPCVTSGTCVAVGVCSGTNATDGTACTLPAGYCASGVCFRGQCGFYGYNSSACDEFETGCTAGVCAPSADSANDIGCIGQSRNPDYYVYEFAGTPGTFGLSGIPGPARGSQIGFPVVAQTDAYNNVYIGCGFACSLLKVAPDGDISFVAGAANSCTCDGDGGLAVNAGIGAPTGVCPNLVGAVVFTDLGCYTVRRIDANGIISTIAGTGVQGYNGNPNASLAQVNTPVACVYTVDEQVYFVDEVTCILSVIDLGTGLISVIAGQPGNCTSGGDGGLASAATLGTPYGLTQDNSGNFLITEFSNRVRILYVNGTINTIVNVAGTPGFCGDGGPAPSACLLTPEGVTVDNAGNIIISDSSNNRVREVSAYNDVINTIFSNFSAGFGGDNGPAISAMGNTPLIPSWMPNNTIVFPDSDNGVVRIMTSFCSLPTSVNGTPCTPLAACSNAASCDGGGNCYDSDPVHSRCSYLDSICGEGVCDPCSKLKDDQGCVFRPFNDGEACSLPAGYCAQGICLGGQCGFYNFDPTLCPQNYSSGCMEAACAPQSESQDGAGCISRSVNRDYFVFLYGGVPGTYDNSGIPGPARAAHLGFPVTAQTDTFNNVYLGGAVECILTKIDPAGNVVYVAGAANTCTCDGDGGLAVNAGIIAATGVCPSPKGSVVFTDLGCYNIRRIDPSGIISTIAGTGVQGYNGDTNASLAQMDTPVACVYTVAEKVYFVDQATCLFSEIDLSTGLISVLAGQPYNCTDSGDGGLASDASLKKPYGLTQDASGNFLITEFSNRVRIVYANGTIDTIVNVAGTPGFCGDGGLAPAACLLTPQGVAVDNAGNIIIADSSNNRIRVVGYNDDVIETVFSNITAGFGGDNGPAITAMGNTPLMPSWMPNDTIVFADTDNGIIRIMTPFCSLPTSVAGTLCNPGFACAGNASCDDKHNCVDRDFNNSYCAYRSGGGYIGACSPCTKGHDQNGCIRIPGPTPTPTPTPAPYPCIINPALCDVYNTPCTNGTCVGSGGDSNGCSATIFPDDTPCTGNFTEVSCQDPATCSSGVCVPGALNDLPCIDGNLCTIDTCNATAGCVHVARSDCSTNCTISPGTAYFTVFEAALNFSTNPLPADTFGNGSQAFSGNIPLEGCPLGGFVYPSTSYTTLTAGDIALVHAEQFTVPGTSTAFVAGISMCGQVDIAFSGPGHATYNVSCFLSPDQEPPVGEITVTPFNSTNGCGCNAGGYIEFYNISANLQCTFSLVDTVNVLSAFSQVNVTEGLPPFNPFPSNSTLEWLPLAPAFGAYFPPEAFQIDQFNTRNPAEAYLPPGASPFFYIGTREDVCQPGVYYC